MKINKKNFSKMIDGWKKHSPESLKDFFFNTFLDKVQYGQDRVSLDKMIEFVLKNNPKLVLEKGVLDNFIEDTDSVVLAQVKPSTKDNYIGIEIECFADMSMAEAMMLAVEYGVSDWVEIADDGSIEPEVGRDFEFKVLLKEKSLKSQLMKLGKFLKAGKFKVNKSCGLHVHLDMRNRDLDKTYFRLLKFQDLMFGMVSSERRSNNEYCAYTDRWNRDERYVAINRSAYAKHKTIEIRLHQGTVDVKLISNWVNLLLKIINTTDRTPRTLQKMDSVIKWLGKSRDLKTYVKKTYKPNWRDTKAMWEPHDDSDDLW